MAREELRLVKSTPLTLPEKAWRVALIVAATFFIYWPVLRGGWLWDDHIDVLQNPVMRDPAGWWKIWLQPTGWHFFPLKTTVLWVQWQLWGENTFGYHLINVGLHVVSALMIWKIFGRLGLRFAWLGGLIFAIHPLAVESVAWIAELKNTLSLPLLLWAFDAWLDHEAGKNRAYGRALILFITAMLAKTSVVMFPVVLLLYAVWKDGRLSLSKIRAALPFLAVSVALGLVTVSFEHRESLELFSITELGFVSRLAGAAGAIAFYCGKFVFPAALSPAYPLWNLEPVPLAWLLVWVAIAIIAVWCGWKWSQAGRHAAFGLGFFLINLVPLLGFVPIAYHHISWVADHFVYLPMIGLIGIGVAAITRCGDAMSRRNARIFLGGGFAAVVLALTWKSRTHAVAFKDEETLWRYTVAVQPDAWLGHFDLAALLARTGRTDEAIIEYRKTLALMPGHAEAVNNLGNALLARGQVNEAITSYEKAIWLRPNYAEAYANLSNALTRVGRDADVAKAAARALDLDPANALANLTLADLKLRAGEPAAAISYYAIALKQRTHDAVLNHNYGCALYQSGRLAEARTRLENAIRLEPDYEQAHVNLGHVLLDLGRETEAVAQWREALRLHPGSVTARVALGNLYVRTVRPAEARAEYMIVLRQNPHDAEVRNNLAFALAQLGLFDEAVRECEEAIRLRPDYREARENLTKLRAIMARPR